MLKSAHIIGWGRYLPDTVLTNDDIAQFVDTNDEWIRSRTGIRQRYVAEPHEKTSTLGFRAAARALQVADISPSQLDLIIVATSTPDHIYPATANLIQDLLGARNAGAFDLLAACTGFVYALDMAKNAIATGSAEHVLVIGSETYSRVLDWEDRSTCILFGDGAGAVVLKGSHAEGGVGQSILGSDGSGGNMLTLPAIYHNPVPNTELAHVDDAAETNTVRMNGRQVYRFATRIIPQSVNQVLEKTGLTIDDISLIIPHQANMRIIDASAKKLGIDPEKFFANVPWVANTSAASIPLALCDAIDAGRVSAGDNIIMVGFGGGLSWGASLVTWNASPVDSASNGTQWRRMRYMAARTRSRYQQARRNIVARVAPSPNKSPNGKPK